MKTGRTSDSTLFINSLASRIAAIVTKRLDGRERPVRAAERVAQFGRAGNSSEGCLNHNLADGRVSPGGRFQGGGGSSSTNAAKSDSHVRSLASTRSAPGCPPMGTTSFDCMARSRSYTTSNKLLSSGSASRCLASKSRWSGGSVAGSTSNDTNELGALIPLRKKST